ncbi:ADP-ribosylglycohydrolase family protein [Kineococcus sp. SYSU DK004]|uniref:ADP-ribosylglycohydrolase family protein n=1 Tax=Kineococcus sp. SYSU DK004 TaxID=3383125 RepID=UPI003D7CB3B2
MERTTTGTVRGLLRGLAAGEALGAADGGAGGVLRHGVAAQLACASAEGVLRAGAGADPVAEVHAAYRRWSQRHRAPVAPGPSPLHEDRGPSGATSRALATGAAGTLREPLTTSAGWHAVVRALPVAALGLAGEGADAAVALTAARTAVLTHGSVTAAPAGVAALVAAAALRGAPLAEAVGHALAAAVLAGLDARAVWAADAAVRAAHRAPGDPQLAEVLAGGPACTGVLAAAVYAVLSHPAEPRLALRLALTGPRAAGAGALAGAWLGAAHGPAALPGRVDVADVLDALADGLGGLRCA